MGAITGKGVRMAGEGVLGLPGCGNRRKSGGESGQGIWNSSKFMGVTSGLVRSKREGSRGQRACRANLQFTASPLPGSLL